MGFMGNSKATAMQQKAQAAWTSGAKYFTPLLNFPAFKLGFSGNVEDWSPMLEAIRVRRVEVAHLGDVQRREG